MAAQKQIANYIQLTKDKRLLENNLKAVKALIADKEPEILEHFAKYGLQNLNQEGVTIYVKRDQWAAREKGVETEQVIQALHDAGLSEFAAPKVNTQSLSAYLRELDRDGEAFPNELEGIIKLTETYKIGSRNGSTKNE